MAPNSALTVVLLLLRFISVVAVPTNFFVWFLAPRGLREDDRKDDAGITWDPINKRRNHKINGHLSYSAPKRADHERNWSNYKARNAICEWLTINSEWLEAEPPRCEFQCHSYFDPDKAAPIQIHLNQDACRTFRDQDTILQLQEHNYVVYKNGVSIGRRDKLLIRPVRDASHHIQVVTDIRRTTKMSFHTELYLNLDRLWYGETKVLRHDLVSNYNHEYVFTLHEMETVAVAGGVVTPTHEALQRRDSIIIFHKRKAIKKKYYVREYFDIHSRNMKLHFRNNYDSRELVEVFDFNFQMRENMLVQFDELLFGQYQSIATQWNGRQLGLGLNENTIKWNGPWMDANDKFKESLRDEWKKIDKEYKKLEAAIYGGHKAIVEDETKKRKHKVPAGQTLKQFATAKSTEFKRKQILFEHLQRGLRLERYITTEIVDGGREKTGQVYVMGGWHSEKEVGTRIFDMMDKLHRETPFNYILVEDDPTRAFLSFHIDRGDIIRYRRTLSHADSTNEKIIKPWIKKHIIADKGDMEATIWFGLLHKIPVYLVDISIVQSFPFLLIDPIQNFPYNHRKFLNWDTLTYSPHYWHDHLELRNHFMVTAINGLGSHHWVTNRKFNMWITVGRHHLVRTETEKIRASRKTDPKGFLPYSMRDLLQQKTAVLPAFKEYEGDKFGINWDIFGYDGWDAGLSAHTEPYRNKYDNRAENDWEQISDRL